MSIPAAATTLTPQACQAEGPDCTGMAAWYVHGAGVQGHYACDVCKQRWERWARTWNNPPLFDRLPKPTECQP